MPRMTLSILDVGHGNCAVLDDSDGIVVIDAGPGSALLEFLTKEEINEIDVLLISHADKDHIEGIIALLASNEIKIHSVWLNTDSKKGSRLWDHLTYELYLSDKKGNLQFNIGLTTTQSNVFNAGTVSIEILAPNPHIASRGPGSTDRRGRLLETNSVSAVIRLVKDDQPLALLAGDIDNIGFENLLEDVPNPTAPITVFPHHGGKLKSGDTSIYARRFCNAVIPEMIIFSIGRGRYDTPRPEIVSTVKETVPGVWIICTQLSEHCATSLPVAEPLHLTHLYSQGREHRKCCAGTLVVSLDSDMLSVLPSQDAHQAFISEFAPTALCLRTNTTVENETITPQVDDES